MSAAPAHDPSLDAPPVAWHRPEGRAGLLLLCEHASNHVPPAFGGLGLPDAEWQRHIAWDIGALALAQALADRLDAPLAYATYSRLLLDLNRPVEAPDSIVERSEATDIPGNHGLAAAHRQWRQRAGGFVLLRVILVEKDKSTTDPCDGNGPGSDNAP